MTGTRAEVCWSGDRAIGLEAIILPYVIRHTPLHQTPYASSEPGMLPYVSLVAYGCSSMAVAMLEQYGTRVCQLCGSSDAGAVWQQSSDDDGSSRMALEYASSMPLSAYE